MRRADVLSERIKIPTELNRLIRRDSGQSAHLSVAASNPPSCSEFAMSYRTACDLLRPGLATQPSYSAGYPQQYVTRRSMGLHQNLILSTRASSPRPMHRAERWWTAPPW